MLWKKRNRKEKVEKIAKNREKYSNKPTSEKEEGEEDYFEEESEDAQKI